MWRSLFLILLAVGCTAPRPVTIDHYRGIYSTHFDGVPDQSAICAVLTNRGSRAVRWVSLRLRAYPEASASTPRWSSSWIYRGLLEPGDSRAVLLVHPPVAREIELEVRSAGYGNGPARGRLLAKRENCSEPELRAHLDKGRRGRTAPGMSLLPIVRRNDPSGPVQVGLPEPGPAIAEVVDPAR
ncbi:MAG: hypothetical protein V3T14_06885 [Myxococcota bacterium]